MYSYNRSLTHLRYIVYLDQEQQKKVAFWTESTIHAVYANENGIKPQQLTSVGYVGFHKGKWVLYEHYQLDGKGFLEERKEKKLIREELSRFPEIHDKALQQKLENTYQKEKNLLTCAAKKATETILSKMKKTFVKSRD